MSVSPVSVAVHGISTGTIILATIQVLFGGGIIAALVKAWPALKKISNDREVIANDREANLLTERAEEMEKMRSRIATLEAEARFANHQIGNLSQCFDAIIMLIEQDPAKAQDAVAIVKRMRAAQMVAEGAEKGALMAGKIKEAGA